MTFSSLASKYDEVRVTVIANADNKINQNQRRWERIESITPIRKQNNAHITNWKGKYAKRTKKLKIINWGERGVDRPRKRRFTWKREVKTPVLKVEKVHLHLEDREVYIPI